MKKLKIQLKQHTPLIHFQHDQEGATLRASEVKPKLDRFILTRLGNGKYQAGIVQAKTNGWLIGKGEHPALDYKVRIKAGTFQKVSIPIKPVKKGGVLQTDEIGRQLYTTNNYPENNASLIMSNIGGRIKEDVLNFSIANTVLMTILIEDEKLKELVKENLEPFFGRNCFGNRTSKGFGSFEVASIDGEPGSGNIDTDSYILSFTMNLGKEMDKGKAYKDVFKIINKYWKALKDISGVGGGKSEKDVLLKIRPQKVNDADRIPSPIHFKPLVDFCKDDDLYFCDVNIAILFDKDVIKEVTGSENTSYYVRKIEDLKDKWGKSLYTFIDNNTEYEIDKQSVKLFN